MLKKGKYIAVRPNYLIEARYDLTSGQNDLMDMVLSKIENDNNYLYELNINDFKKLYKSDTSNIYRDLKKAVKSMEGAGFYLINKNDKGIEKETFFVWFASIDYLETEGKIIVEVGQRLKGLLVEMKKRIYYKIEYPLNFTSIYSKRIYYYLKSFEDTGWRIDNLDTLRKKLQCPKSYDKYGLFRTYVLDMAYREINDYSDISFDFEPIKKGRKVTSIKFIIASNKIRNEIAATKVDEATKEEENYIENVKLIIKNVVGEEITDKLANEFYKYATKNKKYGNNPLELINEVAQYSKTQNVNGFIGWFKSTVSGYEKPIETSKRTNFNDYEQRSYDYDKLERKLLGWDKEVEGEQ